LQEAKENKRVVLFLDAAHFVHSVFVGFLWCFTRVFVQSASGRRRWNVLGALDAVGLKVHTLCNDSYITSASICEFFGQLREYYGTMPITIFLDNARYQRCELVTNCAVTLRIELEFLPTYSPNLNLIERFWKFVKKKSLYSRYYESFEDFKEAINSCITQADSKFKNELRSLLSWNFQTFKHVNILTV
jgi:transposase